MASVSLNWGDMPLDSRILEALKDLKWETPTAVQSACVPLALQGRCLSIQSRTGSGKTGAFAIPILQRLVTEREQGGSAAATKTPVALILVPSVELSEQTAEATLVLGKYIKPRIAVENLTAGGAVTPARVASAHIIVSTAALLATCIRKGSVTAESLQHLRYLVIDEADVVTSIAEKSMRTVQSVLPPSMQVVLASATLSEGVAALKGQLLHNPANIRLTTDDAVPEAQSQAADGPLVESRITLKDTARNTLKQYYLVASDECHQHTLLYGLYRMRLISGKTLIFVDDEEMTYKLQHFLEQMGVATLVYDANLPLNVRLNTLRRFQSGTVSTLVCTDGTLESVEQLQMSVEDGEEEADAPSRKRRRTKKDGGAAPSALHRGIDFSNVRNVILFDGVDATSQINLSRYTHRIGRAGRAGQDGLSIAIFSVPQAKKNLKPLREYCRSRGEQINPFRKMQRAEAGRLQYRVDSVLFNVTRAATRRLRVATVAAELSRSSYLSNHMSERDSEALKRVVGRTAKKVHIEKNLLDVPEYMKLRNMESVSEFTHRVRADQTRARSFRRVTKKKSSDPLRAVVSSVRNQKKKK